MDKTIIELQSCPCFCHKKENKNEPCIFCGCGIIGEEKITKKLKLPVDK